MNFLYSLSLEYRALEPQSFYLLGQPSNKPTFLPMWSWILGKFSHCWDKISTRSNLWVGGFSLTDSCPQSHGGWNYHVNSWLMRDDRVTFIIRWDSKHRSCWNTGWASTLWWRNYGPTSSSEPHVQEVLQSPKTISLFRNQLFKEMSLWEIFHFKP